MAIRIDVISLISHDCTSILNTSYYKIRINTITTTDKVLKYIKNNGVDFSEHPTMIQRGNGQTTNISAAVPNVA